MKNININHFIFILILGLLSSCTKIETEPTRGYLCFTVTYESINENGQEIFLSDIYKYELGSLQPTLIETIPYEKDYPVGVYLDDRNVIIYSGISERVSGNQVWLKNLDTNEKLLLTYDFYYLAYLQPISEDIILVGGVLKNAEDIAINLYELDIDTQKLTKIDFNDDIDVRNVTYDSETKSVLFSGYSHTELRKNIEEQDTVPFKMPNNYIFEYKKGVVTELLEEDDEILSVYRDKNQLQYRTVNSGHLCFDLSKRINCASTKSYLSNPYFDSKSNKVYYIDDQTMNVFDNKSDKETVVFKSNKSLSTINNMFYIEREYDNE